MVVEAGCKKENPHIVPDENVQLYSVKKNIYNLVQHTVLVLSVSISLNCTGFFLTDRFFSTGSCNCLLSDGFTFPGVSQITYLCCWCLLKHLKHSGRVLWKQTWPAVKYSLSANSV